MNKRQIKKRKKIISERIIYFKELKKIYKGVFIAIDWSNGKDYSVKTTYINKDGVIRVLKNEIIN